jgi:hypothetical protein
MDDPSSLLFQEEPYRRAGVGRQRVLDGCLADVGAPKTWLKTAQRPHKLKRGPGPGETLGIGLHGVQLARIIQQSVYLVGEHGVRRIMIDLCAVCHPERSVAQ